MVKIPDHDALLQAGRLDQTCPHCGITEAAGAYCTSCLTPTGDAHHLPIVSPARHEASLRAARLLADRAALRRKSGQVLVELCLVFPILAALLLAVAGCGVWLLGADLQASRATALAAWMGANPDATTEDLAAYGATITSCDWTSQTADNVVRVTISCPSWAHDLVGALPERIETTAVAYIPDPESVTP